MLASTTFVMAWFIIQPIFSLFVLDKGLSVVQLGFLLSLMNFIPLVFRIPLSVVAERIGRVKALLLSFIIVVTSRFMFIYADNWNQLLLVTVYSALSTGSFNQISMSTVSDMAPSDKQGDTMGQYLTFLGFGMLLGPALCSILIDHVTYNQMFLISALFPCIGIMLLLYSAPGVQNRSGSLKRVKEMGVTESLDKIVHNKNVLLLSFCRFSFSTSQAILMTLFPIYAVNSLGFSESSVAFLLTVRGFSNTVARLPAGKLSDRIGRKKPMFAAFSLLVVAFSILSISSNYLLIMGALGLYGLCWGTRAVSEWTLLSDLVEPEIKTISISYLSSIFGMGSTVGSIVAGLLQSMMPFSSIFLLGAALNAGALPAILLMKKDVNENSDPSSSPL